MGARLADKVCLITGAGSAIGQASARLFATEGARVVVADIDPAAARETADEIVRSGGEAIDEQVDASRSLTAIPGRVQPAFASASSAKSSDARKMWPRRPFSWRLMSRSS